MSFQQQEIIQPYRSNSREETQRGSTAPTQRASSANKYNEFNSTPPQYPYCYQPENAFQALQDKSTNKHAKTRGIQQDTSTRDYHIPGYTGFVRGSQHVAGRTYGEATRKALTTSYRENSCTSPIPSGPQNNGRIAQETNHDSFVSKVIGVKSYHLPNYTGYVPGVKTTFGKTYGASTSEHFAAQSKTRGIANDAHKKEGFAAGMNARNMQTL